MYKAESRAMRTSTKESELTRMAHDEKENEQEAATRLLDDVEESPQDDDDKEKQQPDEEEATFEVVASTSIFGEDEMNELAQFKQQQQQ